MKNVWRTSRKYRPFYIHEALKLVKKKLDIHPTNTFKKGRVLNIIIRLARQEAQGAGVIKVLNDKPYLWKKIRQSGLLRMENEAKGIYKFHG